MRSVDLTSRWLLDHFRSWTTGLSGQLLLLTVVFVLLAQFLVFVPSIANMRLSWLQDRLNSAVNVGRVIDSLQTELPREVQDATLHSLGAALIALRKDDTSRLLAAVSRPLTVDEHYDLRDVSTWNAIVDASEILLDPQPKTIRVLGDAEDGDARIEIVISSKPLRDAMMGYVANVTLVALTLSAIVGLLIFVSFNQLFISPIRRLTVGMEKFSEKPDDPSRIFNSGMGKDELAVAGQHLSKMQESLYFALKQQKNLAELGLAVSKINHDMRNILASAQLMSDRLNDVHDPLVKSFAPRLIRTLDRAVSYTEELLSFGQAKENLPKRQSFQLYPVVSEVRDVVLLGSLKSIDFVIDIDSDFTLEADCEHIFRIIYNLARNAAQALDSVPADPADPKRIVISAERLKHGTAIVVDDNGSGMPLKARENLFAAFKGSVRAGGTGLGLVIVRELVLAHGGTIALVEKPSRGTQFRIEIPS